MTPLPCSSKRFALKHTSMWLDGINQHGTVLLKNKKHVLYNTAQIQIYYKIKKRIPSKKLPCKS